MKIRTILNDLLAVSQTALTRPVALAVIAPGTEVAWDNCCEGGGGMLYVRVAESTALYENSRQRGMSASGNCPTLVDVSVKVGVIRCVYSLDDQGYPPTQHEITADGLSALQDSAELFNSLQCYRPQDNVTRVTLGIWEPQGPMGGCAGGEWTVNLRGTVPLSWAA